MSIAPPPSQSQEAERAVLSAALQGADLNPILKELATDDFFSLLHRRVYARMRVMLDAGEQLNLVTLCESMALDSVETATVADLLSPLLVIRTDSDVLSYARIVKAHSLRRKLLAACEQVIQSNGDAPLLAADLQTKTRNYLDSLQSGGGESSWREVFHTWEEIESAAPLNFAIDGFLQNDGCTMIGGLSGAGKTLMLLSITKALFTGTMLWDTFQVLERAARVLYLIPESALPPFRHRLDLFGLRQYLAPNDERLLVRTLSKGPTPTLSDPRILFAAKGAHVILDTAVRFSIDGDENSAGDNQRGLASDIFSLLGAGARSVLAAHHSPKPFAKENVMRLENVLRGSGDIGAMLSTCWGIKQLDAENNIIHVENVKPRDFRPCQPFQLIGRPFIDQTGDFRLLKRPGECGLLMDEQEPERDKGGASAQAREAKAANIALLKQWVETEPGSTSEELSRKFAALHIDVNASTVRHYRREINKVRA